MKCSSNPQKAGKKVKQRLKRTERGWVEASPGLCPRDTLELTRSFTQGSAVYPRLRYASGRGAGGGTLQPIPQSFASGITVSWGTFAPAIMEGSSQSQQADLPHTLQGSLPRLGSQLTFSTARLPPGRGWHIYIPITKAKRLPFCTICRAGKMELKWL